METITLSTRTRTEMIAVTRQVRDIVSRNGWRNGAVLLFCPHTTAGLTVNENADPDVQRDMCTFMNTLVPQHNGFAHSEGNSDAHVKTSLFGPHLLLIVEEGQVRLGTWQGVYFCEWDGPRDRTVWVQFLPGRV